MANRLRTHWNRPMIVQPHRFHRMKFHPIPHGREDIGQDFHTLVYRRFMGASVRLT